MVAITVAYRCFCPLGGRPRTSELGTDLRAARLYGGPCLRTWRFRRNHPPENSEEPKISCNPPQNASLDQIDPCYSLLNAGYIWKRVPLVILGSESSEPRMIASETFKWIPMKGWV